MSKTPSPTVIPQDLVLWGTPLPNAILAGVAMVFSIFAPALTRALFFLVKVAIRNYSKTTVWSDLLHEHLYYWASWMARTGLFWVAFAVVGIPEEVYAVLRHFVTIPFCVVLFIFTNSLFKYVTAIADVEYQQRARQKQEASSEDFVLADATKEGIRLLKYVAYILVLVVACLIQRVDILTFLQDASVISLVVVFALQPWLRNLLAGVTLFTDRKFSLKERVTLAGIHGSIKSISLRSTVLTRDDNSIAIIPNHLATASSIVNHSRRNARLLAVKFHVSHSTPTIKLRQLVKDLDVVLQTLHPEITSHRSNLTFDNVSARLEESSDEYAGQQRKMLSSMEHSVLLHDMYQILVWTYVGKDAISDKPLNQLKSEVIFSVKEAMDNLEILPYHQRDENWINEIEYLKQAITVPSQLNDTESDDEKIVTAALLLS